MTKLTKDVHRHRQRYYFLMATKDLKTYRAGDTRALLARGASFLALLSPLQEVADLPSGWNLTTTLLHFFPVSELTVQAIWFSSLLEPCLPELARLSELGQTDTSLVIKNIASSIVLDYLIVEFRELMKCK